jgi:Spy/CpxP family protein refolding chaperone
MNKKLRFIGGTGLLLFFFSAAAFAQQEKPPPNRQRVRENLATLRLLRLTQALDLNEDQAAKIFPTVNKIEKEKLQLQRSLSVDIRDLRQILLDPSPKDAEIEAKVGKIREGQKLVRAKDAELESFLENSLTTVQKAKYVIFQIEFYRLMEQTLDRLRMPRNNPAAPPVKK